MLFVLKLHRSKTVLRILFALSVFLFAGNAAFAKHGATSEHLSYRTQLGQDLDGDHKPETATIRQAGVLYQVSIHFTTGRPKIRLATYLTEGIAGLSFEATDVNNDSKGDLIIVSATSLRPIAVWLNQGRASFKKVHSAYLRGVDRYTGPTYNIRGKSTPEPAGNISTDPLPHAATAPGYLLIEHATVAVSLWHSDPRPMDCLLQQEPPRGPPAPVCV